MRIRIKKGRCYNYKKVPCKHNNEVCITCYIYAGHGTELKYEEGKRDDKLD